jgi:hypothetical protein
MPRLDQFAFSGIVAQSVGMKRSSVRGQLRPPASTVDSLVLMNRLKS